MQSNRLDNILNNLRCDEKILELSLPSVLSRIVSHPTNASVVSSPKVHPCHVAKKVVSSSIVLLVTFQGIKIFNFVIIFI